jgi:tungstate transport system ATP-binding protein
MPILKTAQLGYSCDSKVLLKNVTFDVEKGEVFALIGPTGAGKTTLLRLLNLLDTPTVGKIYFDEQDTAKSARLKLEMRRRMGMVFQKPAVFNSSVYENIAYPLKVRGCGRKEIQTRVEEMLEITDLKGYEKRKARTLSGGEAQRVALARAIIAQPELVLLDEPTANLDPVSVSKIEEVLTRIIHEQKTTVIMATHDMSQGQRLADRIGVLMNGELLQIGSPSEIFCSPSNKEVAEFVGVENILSGTVVDKEAALATINIDGGVIEAISEFTVGDEIYAIIRPEDITFRLAKDTSSARNVFEGKITRITTVGPLVRIELDCGFSLLGVVTRKSADELNLSRGQKIYASFKATVVHTVKRWS